MCCRDSVAVTMALLFSRTSPPRSWQIVMRWKLRHCCRVFANRQTMLQQNVTTSPNSSLIRCLTASSALRDAKQLTNEAADADDETPPAEILANLSPEDSKRWKVLKLEYDVLMSTGVRVPDTVRDKDWVYLLYRCSGPHSRAKYYNYLFKREKSIANDVQTRAKLKLAREERLKQYKIQKQEGDYPFLNTFNLFIRPATMNQWYCNNLLYALMNGPHLVFDFSFEYEMTEREIINLAQQIQYSHGENKIVREPFHFHFCNLRPNSRTAKKLDAAIKYDFRPYTVTDRHYLEFYDKERLVWLTPNAPHCMTSFNEDDVYIVGAMVDKVCQKPLTFAKAKQEKIRCVRFPLDEHVRWVQGSKNLTLNNVVTLLLALRRTGSWEKALVETLPRRKFRQE